MNNEEFDVEAFLKRMNAHALTDEQAEERRKAEEEAEKERRAVYDLKHGTAPVRALIRCGFGRREAEASFRTVGDLWKEKQCLVLKRLSENGTVLISGDCGTGKTVMAASVSHAFLKAGKSVRYTRALDFFVMLRSTFSRESTLTESKVRATHEDVDLLIIDEVQDRGESNWENSLLNNLIDRRYSALMPTLLITNQTGEKAENILPTSIYSRIEGSGSLIACPWKSYRSA